MESKGRRRLLNALMVILILVIAASAVVTVGMVRGWFTRKEEAALASGKTKGVVNIERKGIGYTLKRGTALAAGDLVETKKGAEAELLLEERDTFVLNQNSEVQLADCGSNTVSLKLDQGELFGDAAEYGGTLEVAYGENLAMLAGAVFSVSAQPGSWALNIYEGDVSVTLPDGTQERVEAGEYLSSVSDREGTVTHTVEELWPGSLGEFVIRQAQACGSAQDLCFAPGELQGVLDGREAERQAALEASLNPQNQIPLGAEKMSETESEETGGTRGVSELESEKAAGADSGDGQASGEGIVQENVQEQENVQNAVEEYVSDGSSWNAQEEQAQDVQQTAKVCTLEIRCDTILDNLDNLREGKESYVPANGCILDTSLVEFTDGETAFDVLQRVCDFAGIQLEYSWTPMYDSYYIEGINNLYEFDCGNQSGWMFKVNGWFPNYGCSSYFLEDGDVITFVYTCSGLGADVGGSV